MLRSVEDSLAHEAKVWAYNKTIDEQHKAEKEAPYMLEKAKEIRQYLAKKDPKLLGKMDFVITFIEDELENA